MLIAHASAYIIHTSPQAKHPIYTSTIDVRLADYHAENIAQTRVRKMLKDACNSDRMNLNAGRQVLELPRLGDGRDTSLLSGVLAAERALAAFVDCALRRNLLLGLLERQLFLDTRVAAGLVPPRGEAAVLLDRTSDGTRSVGRLVLERGTGMLARSSPECSWWMLTTWPRGTPRGRRALRPPSPSCAA